MKISHQQNKTLFLKDNLERFYIRDREKIYAVIKNINQKQKITRPMLNTKAEKTVRSEDQELHPNNQRKKEYKWQKAEYRDAV